MVIDTQAQSQTASVPPCIFTCKTHTLWSCSEDYRCQFPITSVAPYKVNPWKITIGLGRILLGWGKSKPSVGIIGIKSSSVKLTQGVVQGAQICMVSAITYLSQNPLRSDQIRSVVQSCPTLCHPMNRSTPGLPVHHQLPEFIQPHVHRVSDAIQPSHPLSSPSPPAPNPSQHQSLFQSVNSSHEVAKVLEFQL